MGGKEGNHVGHEGARESKLEMRMVLKVHSTFVVGDGMSCARVT